MMSENKWHKEMDDWLKDAIDDLPNPKVSDWEAFEINRKQSSKKKGLLWFSSALAVLLLFSLFNNTYHFQTGIVPVNPDIKETPKQEKNVAPIPKENIQVEVKPSSSTIGLNKNINATPTQKPVTNSLVTQNKVKNSLKQTQATFNNHVKTANIQESVAHNWAAESFAVEEESPRFESIPEIERNSEMIRQTSLALKPETTDTNNSSNTIADYEPEEGLFEDEKFSITLGFYPNYTFRDIEVRGSDQNKVHKEYMSIVTASEKGGMAFNVGAELKYKVGQNIFLGSGINFIQTKITGAYDFEITEDPILDPSTQNIIGYRPTPEGTYVNTGILNSYSYLQIPLVLSYQPWINKKLRMVVEGGTSYLHFLKAEGTTIDYQNLRTTDLANLNYNENMFTVNFKIGVNYYLNPQFALGLEPTFMYFSNSVYTDDYPIYMVPWSIGVNFNMKVRLR